MKPRQRLTLFFIGAAAIGAMFFIVFVGLPGELDLRNRYAVAINTRVVPERNTTDAVTAINFDYRGFDTLGEEFILFVSVMGSLVLLRQPEEKKTRPLPDAITPERDVRQGDAVRLWTLGMAAPKVLFGLYVVTHGQLSPGGGFQGGVILTSAVLIIYLGENFETFKRVMSHTLVEIVEAAGAGGFVLIGMLAWFWGREFLTNTLPLGKSNELTSAGTIPLISFATGIEVMAGFVLLLYAFLQTLLTVEEEQ